MIRIYFFHLTPLGRGMCFYSQLSIQWVMETCKTWKMLSFSALFLLLASKQHFRYLCQENRSQSRYLIYAFFPDHNFGFLLVCLKISLFKITKTFTRGGIGCDWARWVLLLLRAESTKEPSQARPAYLWEVASLGFVGYVKFIWSCNSLTWKSWLFSLAWQNFMLSHWISAYWKVPAVWMWAYVWFGD